MSWQAPNLAARPFVNLRPLVRIAGTLAVVALALTAWNLVAFVRAGSGAAAQRAEIARFEREIGAARTRLATVDGDLARRDLAAENRRAVFLNAQIAQRAFGWNALLDRLGEVQPRGVRLRSLKPDLGAATGEGESSPVRLRLAAEATDGESMLELVDALFAHAAFADPNLQRERRTAGGIEFDLEVVYFPAGRP